jgi:hypothetical protein
MDDGRRPPAADDRWRHRLAAMAPRLVLLAVFAVVVGLLVHDQALGLGLVVAAQVLSLVPEIVRKCRKP